MISKNALNWTCFLILKCVSPTFSVYILKKIY